jgi:hypothetical protein
MDQVSRPLLIVLAATVALLAVWLVALRPQPAAVSDTPLAPTQAIPQAEQAAAISDAANAKVQAAAGNAAQAAPAAAQAAPAAAQAAPAAAQAAPAPAQAASAGTSSGAGAKATAPGNAAKATPATASKRSIGQRRDAAIMRAVKRGKVVVMLFWNADGADDVATRGALRTLDRHHGKVVVRVVSIANVARYPSVTKGVKIAGSPTTVVIGRKGRTRVIAGLTEPRELSQAVGDALAGR